MYGPESISINFVDFNNDDYIRSSLLGTRYLFGNAGYNAPQKVYTPVGEAGANSKITMHFRLDICMIKNGVPAGLKKLSGLDKTLTSLSGFYYTDAEKNGVYKNAFLPEGTDTSLMEKVSEAVDCTMENNADGITVRDLGADPNVIFPGVESDFADENKLYGLSLTMDVSDDTEMAVYYQTEGDDGRSKAILLNHKET